MHKQKTVDIKHMKISDFPKTPWPVSFGVRQATMKAFNYCRRYPEKMESLKAVLTFVLKRVTEWEVAASEVDWPQRGHNKPLQSVMDTRPAQTISTKTGQLHPQVTVNHETTQAVVHNALLAQLSKGTQVPGVQTVPPVPRVPNPNNNPVKQAPMMSVFNEPKPTTLTAGVAGAITQPLQQRTLAEVLAAQAKLSGS